MTAGEVLTYCGPVTASWVVLDWTDMATNLSLLLPRATDVAVHDMAAVVAVSYLQQKAEGDSDKAEGI